MWNFALECRYWLRPVVLMIGAKETLKYSFRFESRTGGLVEGMKWWASLAHLLAISFS